MRRRAPIDVQHVAAMACLAVALGGCCRTHCEPPLADPPVEKRVPRPLPKGPPDGVARQGECIILGEQRAREVYGDAYVDEYKRRAAEGRKIEKSRADRTAVMEQYLRGEIEELPPD